MPPNLASFTSVPCFKKSCGALSLDLSFTISFPGNAPKLTFETRHAPLSVGIATNVPNFEEGVCFVTNGDEN